ncbi:aminotransferase class V-fold PLP-dependent enzyme, partial [Streptococcus pasteurianus]
SNNWALKGTAYEKAGRGKHIITSSVEHPSVSHTLKELEQEGFEVTYLPVDKEGRVNPKDLQAALRPDTILVSIMAVNNEIGTIQPIKEIAEILTDYPTIHFHVDGVQ